MIVKTCHVAVCADHAKLSETRYTALHRQNSRGRPTLNTDGPGGVFLEYV